MNEVLQKKNDADLKKILIVGVDSEIGSELKKLTLKNGFEVKGTSRRKEFI